MSKVQREFLNMSTEFVFEVVLLMLVGVLGIIGNCWLLGMFAKLHDKLNFHRLMMTLAIYDNIYVLLCLIIFSMPQIFEDYKLHGYHFYIAPKALAVVQMSLTGSVYCTVSISIERYLTVCHPFYIAAKKWSSKRYIIPIVIFSVLYNISRFFELRTNYVGCQDEYVEDLQKIQECQENITEANMTHFTDVKNLYTNKNQNNCSGDEHQDSLSGCNISLSSNVNNVNSKLMSITDTFTSETIRNIIPRNSSRKYNYTLELTVMRKNKYYYAIYIICLNFVFHGLIPFVIIITLNTLTYRELKEIELKPAFISRRSTITWTVERQQLRSEGESVQTENRTFKIKRSELVLVRVSLAIVLVMLICHSIRWIPNIYELIQRISQTKDIEELPKWVESYTQISHFLTVLNSSVNFYIYVITHYSVSSFTHQAFNRPSVV